MSIEQVEEIETKYAVESIRAKDHQVWPLIRFSLWAYYSSEVEPIRTKSLGFSKVRELLLQFFYGFRFFFRKYDYLAFSDSSERKLINGKWVDKSVDFILENLPQSLLIEIPLPTHHKKATIPTHFIASKLPLYGLEWFYSTFFLKGIKIENEHIIQQILREINLEFDYRSVLKRNIAQYKIGTLLNRLYKPKGVVIQCAYTNTGFVKAFKDSGVKVVEVQHGLISPAHVAYNVFKKLDDSYFPDYFLSFGDVERFIFNERNFYIASSNVIPVGHYYLDEISDSSHTISNYIPHFSRYSKLIAVTGQNLPVIEQKLIDFLKEAALLCGQVGFMYIPRNEQSTIFRNKDLPSNVVVVTGRDTYELIRLSTFHSTIHSTCAIESLVLGTPNILINIDNLSKSGFGKVFDNTKSTVYVDSVEEYVEIINDPRQSREEVILENSYLIQANYKKNIITFLNKTFKN